MLLYLDGLEILDLTGTKVTSENIEIPSKTIKKCIKGYKSKVKETKEFKQKVTYESQKEETTNKRFKEKTFAKISSKKRSFSRKKLNQTTKNLHLEEIGDNDD